MMEKTLNSLREVWQVVLMMAPYLLLGFVVAGVLSVMLTPAWIARNLGRRGLRQVVKASLIGVPLPLCSCGVIPLAFSLRKAGAGKGATVSFLASTPQTGVDSILLTYSLLGPVLSAIRVAAAFVSGIVAGRLTDWLCGDDASADGRGPIDAHACCCGGDKEAAPIPARVAAACCAGEGAVEANAARRPPAWRRALRHGCVTLPRDMARPLLLGVLVSGVVAGLVPEGFFAGRLPPGVASYALALVVGIPIYVCSASSVPIAATFIHMGVSPGAAMVFLISGPATNAATVLAMWRQIGRSATAVYLAVIAAVSILAGVLLDGVLGGVRDSVPVVRAAAHAHPESATLGSVTAAVVLLILLIPGLWKHEESDMSAEGLSP